MYLPLSAVFESRVVVKGSDRRLRPCWSARPPSTEECEAGLEKCSPFQACSSLPFGLPVYPPRACSIDNRFTPVAFSTCSTRPTMLAGNNCTALRAA